MAKHTTLYQHGTLALLVPGLLKGTMTMGDLLKHGDTGIGTGEGLDGELIILNGKPYQVAADGKVNVVPDSFTMPFANIHYARYLPLAELENVSQDDLNEQIVSLSKAGNTFFRLKLRERFRTLKLGLLESQSRRFIRLPKRPETRVSLPGIKLMAL